MKLKKSITIDLSLENYEKMQILANLHDRPLKLHLQNVLKKYLKKPNTIKELLLEAEKNKTENEIATKKSDKKVLFTPLIQNEESKND